MFYRFGAAAACVLSLCGCQESGSRLDSTTALTAPSALSANAPAEMPAPSSVPENAAGTYQVGGGSILSVRALPNACFIELTLTLQLAGTFEGTLTAPLTMFSRGACPAQGTADELHGQGTFAGTVQGSAGTLRVEVRARHSADGIAEMRVVALRGDGELSGLHAVLWGTGPQGVGGTYEGRVHFEP